MQLPYIKKSDIDTSALFTLSFRLVIGWTYFSALWRRMILADKLDPELAGYVGHKFNHFLPNALGIQWFIEYLLFNPEILWWVMFVFTIVEGVFGLFLMLGLFTRLSSFVVINLALGILLSAGWIGTTCLDEWQIGILGLAGGLSLFWSGGGKVSLDHFFFANRLNKNSFFNWISSGVLALNPNKIRKISVGLAVFVLGLSLFTNQYFHGGVWGDLHNKSVKPKLELSQPNKEKNALSFELFRVEGVDVYGSFLIKIQALDQNNQELSTIKNEEFKSANLLKIDNHYISKIRPESQALVIPLGGKAVIQWPLPKKIIQATDKIRLTDVSGITWELNF